MAGGHFGELVQKWGRDTQSSVGGGFERSIQMWVTEKEEKKKQNDGRQRQRITEKEENKTKQQNINTREDKKMEKLSPSYYFDCANLQLVPWSLSSF